MRGRGLFPLIGAIGALIIWAIHFLAIYCAQATACMRAAPDATLLGHDLVPALVLGLTAFALLAVAAVGIAAWRRLADGMTARAGEHEPHFLTWLTVAVALLSSLAILWEAVPVLILPPCG
ncbi:hypothetical protein [Roseomonas sp. AR75]|uniref:hypothetical protein n=1 Tax=Roseomonas sp. AR75 TaxID=2562311 RepID=UPI0010C0904A|nr:hypothetical protein [Roseomonas sp. AR75]